MFLVMDLQHVPNSFIGDHLKITGFDLGMFLLGFTLYTAIMWIGSMAVHTAMFLTFLTLLAEMVDGWIFKARRVVVLCHPRLPSPEPNGIIL